MQVLELEEEKNKKKIKNKGEGLFVLHEECTGFRPIYLIVLGLSLSG